MIALRARGQVSDIQPFPAAHTPRYVYLRCTLANDHDLQTVRLAFTGAERNLPDTIEIDDSLDASGPAQVYIHHDGQLRAEITVSKLYAFDGAGWTMLLEPSHD